MSSSKYLVIDLQDLLIFLYFLAYWQASSTGKPSRPMSRHGLVVPRKGRDREREREGKKVLQ